MRCMVACAAAMFALVGCMAQEPAAVLEWQKALGPAALEARHTHASVDVMTLGDGAQRVYVFLPAEPAVHGAGPMVFFHHGWQGMDPKNYGALIDHLVREGNVVLFPVYQDSDETSPQTVVRAAAEAERAALAELAKRGVTPDAQRVVYFGYSMGAAISLNLAAHVAEWKLPAPQALVLAAPGDSHHVAKGEAAKSILPPMSELPSTLPVAIVTGEDDTFIGAPTGRMLAKEMCGAKSKTQMPSDRRVLLMLPSDEHGGVKVRASHAAPGAPDSRYDFALTTPVDEVPKHIAGRVGFEASASLNQLDFYGFWKVLDAVIDSLTTAPSSSAKYVPPAIVFRSGPEQIFLGTWADGTAYRAAHVEDFCGVK